MPPQNQLTNGKDAAFYDNFSDTQFENLEDNFRKIDDQAIIQDHVWKDELETLLANRAYYRSNG